MILLPLRLKSTKQGESVDVATPWQVLMEGVHPQVYYIYSGILSLKGPSSLGSWASLFQLLTIIPIIL